MRLCDPQVRRQSVCRLKKSLERRPAKHGPICRYSCRCGQTLGLRNGLCACGNRFAFNGMWHAVQRRDREPCTCESWACCLFRLNQKRAFQCQCKPFDHERRHGIADLPADLGAVPDEQIAIRESLKSRGFTCRDRSILLRMRVSALRYVVGSSRVSRRRRTTIGRMTSRYLPRT
jgi:hypothetical protein